MAKRAKVLNTLFILLVDLTFTEVCRLFVTNIYCSLIHYEWMFKWFSDQFLTVQTIRPRWKSLIDSKMIIQFVKLFQLLDQVQTSIHVKRLKTS